MNRILQCYDINKNGFHDTDLKVLFDGNPSHRGADLTEDTEGELASWLAGALRAQNHLQHRTWAVSPNWLKYWRNKGKHGHGCISCWSKPTENDWDRCKNINKKKETKDVKVEGNATSLISIYKWECRWILSKQEHKLSEQAYVWMRTKVSTNKHRILPTPYIPLHAAQEKPRVIGLTNSRDVQNAKMFKIN